MRELKCLRCDAPMRYIKREKLQLGQTGFLLGDLSNLIAGSLEADIYSCSKCGKIELFRPEEESSEEIEMDFDESSELPPETDLPIVGVSSEGIPQVRCAACGKKHDFDYPQCPYCGYESDL